MKCTKCQSENCFIIGSRISNAFGPDGELIPEYNDQTITQIVCMDCNHISFYAPIRKVVLNTILK